MPATKTKLSKLTCDESIAPLLRPAEVRSLKRQIKPLWKLVKGKIIEREYKFPDFKKALAFTNWIGKLADQQGHHPDVFLTYGKVRLQISTHSAGGLTQNDFILASKFDRVA
jgi:4a-hydroxytetrahydrobiopterin dehydratase